MVASKFFGTSVAAAVGVSAAGQFLAPAQDINFQAGANAQDPLKWLGANGPWHAGPKVNGISSDVPGNCYVDQVATVSRHGSRFPDQGAYNGWVKLQEKLSAGGYSSTGSLSFMPNWKTVLTNPSRQIAMLSPTGVKEALGMGYQLRTRYPNLYSDDDDFLVWANNYTRVLQTAEMFVRGYLGWEASTRGNIIAVTSRGFPGGIGDSLAPSDMCPDFKDTEGSDKKNEWDAVWIPPVLSRLCGFESQITGRLSPWCDVFTDDELKSYQYSNDMRYFYGTGPGTDLNKKMMTPFLNALVGLFQKGPGGVNGTRADGSSFRLPSLIPSFLNDGQLTELVTASGVFDEQPMLSVTERNDDRLWVGSRHVTMRGTIAFERLNCRVTRKCKPRAGTSSPVQNATYVRILLNDAVYPVPSCKNGPGSSCLLDDYAKYVADKYKAEGDWIENCNVTIEGAPTKVKGASFFTDLTRPWVRTVKLG